MLSDAPAFTVGILLHTQRLDLSRRCLVGTTAVTYLWCWTSFSWLCYAATVIHMDWSGLWGFFSFFFSLFFLKMLVRQFWEACQAVCSTNAFSLGDKTEMTRQSPFCQHCHGSTGTTVYPKVNGMTECQTGRKVCLFYLKWVDGRRWCHVTHRCESTKGQISKR